MKMRAIPALLFAATLIASAAIAEPIITNGKSTAWLAENNSLYIENASGSIKVLRSPIGDLIGMDSSTLYCLTTADRLYAIGLNGGGTTYISSSPTEEELMQYRTPSAFALEGGCLYQTGADGCKTQLIAERVEAAGSNATDIFYAAEGKVYSILLNGQVDDIEVLGSYEGVCSSLHASTDSVALKIGEDAVVLFDLTGSVDGPVSVIVPAIGSDEVVSVRGKVYLYKKNGTNHLVTYSGDNGLNGGTVDLATVRPTAEPTATPTAIPRPTSKKTRNPYGKDYIEGAINYGDRGRKVLQMQTRLSQLGYPVGTLDGVYGADTLMAVKLFQENEGVKIRSAVIPEVQNILYSGSAKTFDVTAKLTKGDSSMRVTFLQTYLNKMGYLQKIDGDYNSATAEAVYRYQVEHDLFGSGVADKETMCSILGLPYDDEE